MSVILQRQALKPPPGNLEDEINTARRELHDKAYDLLRWSPTRPTIPSYTLRNTLRQLDIHPFTPKSVRKYQSWKVASPKPRVMVGLLFTVIVAYLACHWGVMAAHAKDGFGYGIGATATSIAAVIIFISTVTSWAEIERIWVAVEPSRMPKRMSIPDFALHTAIRVKEALPAVKIEVEYLTEKRVPAPDPFLVASLGNERFYLEVWEEPAYKEEREPLDPT